MRYAVKFIEQLEKELTTHLQQQFDSGDFSIEYSAKLYSAAINTMKFILLKLLPRETEKLELIYNKHSDIMKMNNGEIKSQLLYIALCLIFLGPENDISASQQSRLDIWLQLIEKLKIKTELQFLFLYEYYAIKSKRCGYKTITDISLDGLGNLRFNDEGFSWDYTGSGVIKELISILTNDGKPIEISYNLKMFILGVVFSSKSRNKLAQPDDLLIGGLRDLVSQNAVNILNRINPEGSNDKLQDILLYELNRLFSVRLKNEAK